MTKSYMSGDQRLFSFTVRNLLAAVYETDGLAYGGPF